jgi:TrmH family RNA methyltransferase
VPDITSRQHSIVQAFKHAARGEGDLVLLDGWHLLHEAASAQLELQTIALAGTPQTSRDAALIEHLARRCDVFTVTTAVMDAMSPVRTPSGVVALASRREYQLRQLVAPQPALVIVAVDIQDPGNVGAIIRSVEAGGGSGVVFAGASADPWGWKALRAAMGSTFRLPVMRSTTLAPLLHAMRDAGLAIVATVPRDGILMRDVELARPTAVLVGAEGSGLDSAIVDAADERLTIPMESPVESLNVAVSAALLVYEARRQREA